jgi:ribosomal protein S18 acetylase RimI-like enzyme
LTARVRIVPISKSAMERDVEQFVALGDADIAWPAEKFLSDRPGKWELSLAAFDGQTPVACLIASFRRPGVPHVHLLQVDGRLRSQGIGNRLMEAYLGSLESRSTLKVEVANRRAVAFYKRHGFRVMTRKGDHFWMQSASRRSAQ